MPTSVIPSGENVGRIVVVIIIISVLCALRYLKKNKTPTTTVTKARLATTETMTTTDDFELLCEHVVCEAGTHDFGHKRQSNLVHAH